jgi:hypothetical protein
MIRSFIEFSAIASISHEISSSRDPFEPYAGCSVGADPKPTRLESLCAELDGFTQDTKIVEADRQRIDDIRLDYCPS